MKSVKRISSLLLALLMILTMSVTTFAAGTTGTTETKGSITIANPMTGQTYTAYKIFDVVYNDGKTAYSYTIDSGSAWFNDVKTYAEDASKGLTLTRVNGTDQYIVEKKDEFRAPDFSNALKDAKDGKTGGIPLNNAEGKASATGLPLGYYFVTSNNGALCNLTTTDPDVTIHDKNDVPFEKTEDKTFADVGDKVTYTITGKVPEYAGFSTYTYKIADTMSDGLTFNKDVKVTVDGVDKTTECTVTPNVDGNANKFTVSIPVKDKKYAVGAEIKVTYTATLNKKAIATISNNAATLTYSNNPTSGEEKTTTPSEQKVYSSKIVIDKYDKDDSSKKLSGAEFVLYKEDGSNKLYYKWNTTDEKVEWVEKAEATPVITDNSGAASVEGLANGTYYLEETKAPAGYNPLSEPKMITVNGNADTETSLTTKEGVANSRGALLPSTGGMGTTFFYVIGGIFVLASVVLLITRKRMEKVEK